MVVLFNRSKPSRATSIPCRALALTARATVRPRRAATLADLAADLASVERLDAFFPAGRPAALRRVAFFLAAVFLAGFFLVAFFVRFLVAMLTSAVDVNPMIWRAVTFHNLGGPLGRAVAPVTRGDPRAVLRTGGRGITFSGMSATLQPAKQATAPGAGVPTIWLDGKWYDRDTATVSVYDHGLLYGDGVF